MLAIVPIGLSLGRVLLSTTISRVQFRIKLAEVTLVGLGVQFEELGAKLAGGEDEGEPVGVSSVA